MKQYIEAIKKVDKNIFTNPVLRPFKDLEIVLRGVGDNYNAISCATVMGYSWSPYDRAIKKLKISLKEIERIDYNDPEVKESLKLIDKALSSVFDNRILQSMVVDRMIKKSLKSLPKEFTNKVTVFTRQGSSGQGGYVSNYIYDIMIEDEVFNASVSVPLLNNFKHYFNVRDIVQSLLPIEHIKNSIEIILKDKVRFQQSVKSNN